MKTYQIPITEIQLLTSDRMMDTINLSPGGGARPEDALMYAPESPKVR